MVMREQSAQFVASPLEMTSPTHSAMNQVETLQISPKKEFNDPMMISSLTPRKVSDSPPPKRPAGNEAFEDTA